MRGDSLIRRAVALRTVKRHVTLSSAQPERLCTTVERKAMPVTLEASPSILRWYALEQIHRKDQRVRLLVERRE